MPRAMITGGAGFIGSQLVRELLRIGFEVLVYDNLSTGKREFVPADRAVSFVRADILDLGRLVDGVRSFDPEVVFHLAAIHYVPYCATHPLETLRVNVEGTMALLEACRKANVERIVAASSAAVYPVSDNANSESSIAAPCDIYGLSKLFCEQMVQHFHAETEISCVVARLFNVYGPRETNSHVVPALLGQLGRSESIELGNLDCARDFVHVKDVSRALVMLSNWKGAGFDIFNVGTGREYSVRELVEICERILRRDIKIKVSPSLQRRTDRRHLLADIDKIRALIGWQSEYDVPQGIAELLMPQSGLTIAS